MLDSTWNECFDHNTSRCERTLLAHAKSPYVLQSKPHDTNNKPRQEKNKSGMHRYGMPVCRVAHSIDRPSALAGIQFNHRKRPGVFPVLTQIAWIEALAAMNSDAGRQLLTRSALWIGWGMWKSWKTYVYNNLAGGPPFCRKGVMKRIGHKFQQGESTGSGLRR